MIPNITREITKVLVKEANATVSREAMRISEQIVREIVPAIAKKEAARVAKIEADITL